MGRPKLDIIVEPSIKYLLKNNKSYRNMQRELNGRENEISLSTIHQSNHSICKTLKASRTKPKTGPYRKTPQKSTSAVIR